MNCSHGHVYVFLPADSPPETAPEGADMNGGARCTVCQRWFWFCDECGAIMDGELTPQASETAHQCSSLKGTTHE